MEAGHFGRQVGMTPIPARTPPSKSFERPAIPPHGPYKVKSHEPCNHSTQSYRSRSLIELFTYQECSLEQELGATIEHYYRERYIKMKVTL